MSKLSKLTLLSILSLTSLSAYDKTDSMCCPDSYPERVTVRAIEGKGVGYKTGYTTLEGFFTVPSLMDTEWVPFLDLRGHVFNDGKTAANAGIGLRYVGSSQVWGINSYYDFRHTSHKDFNQYGLGLECLGRVFDFRINGYLPFGKKESRFYGAKFDGFKGHSLIISQKRDVAFKGANAEVGYHKKLTDDINFYTAAGPYFIGHRARNAWGGELRVAFDFTKYLRLEGNTSYDRIFRWIGQGQVSVNIPFGPRDRIQRRGCNSCDKQLMLRDRSLQRVDRDEIIVLEKRRSDTVAIDPATGLPFFFVFVNNTSHSLGTFESPYPTLTQAEANSAPGNIIMVSSGSGAAYTNQLIALKDNQKLWGTGLSYLLKTKQGSVTIPALSAFPTISTTGGFPHGSYAIRLGNNCEVAGLNFSNFTIPAIGAGLEDGSIPGITNTYIHDNIFTNGTKGGILLGNCQGNLQIFNNQMTNVLDTTGSVGGISLINGNAPLSCNAAIVGNTILNSQTFGIHLLFVDNVGTTELYVADNTTNNTAGGFGIIIVNQQAGGSLCGTVINNISNNNPDGGLFVSSETSTPTQLSINGNTFIGNSGSGFNASVGVAFPPPPAGPLCLSMTSNTATNNSPAGYSFTNSNATNTFQVENLNTFSNYNVGSVSTTGTITSVPAGTCTCD